MQILGWFLERLTKGGKFKEAAWALREFCWLFNEVYQRRNFCIFEAERCKSRSWYCSLLASAVFVFLTDSFVRGTDFLFPKLINFSALICFPYPLIRQHFSPIYGSERPEARVAPSRTQRPVPTCDLCSHCMHGQCRSHLSKVTHKRLLCP